MFFCFVVFWFRFRLVVSFVLFFCWFGWGFALCLVCFGCFGCLFAIVVFSKCFEAGILLVGEMERLDGFLLGVRVLVCQGRFLLVGFCWHVKCSDKLLLKLFPRIFSNFQSISLLG